MKSFYYNGRNRAGLDEAITRLDCTKHIWRIRIDEYDEKTREQEKRYHAIIGDIARQAKHLNQVLDTESWKRLLVDQFRRDAIESDIPRVANYWRAAGFRVMPSLDGTSIVQLGAQTRQFPKYVASAFMDWLQVYCAENNITIKDFDKEVYL